MDLLSHLSLQPFDGNYCSHSHIIIYTFDSCLCIALGCVVSVLVFRFRERVLGTHKEALCFKRQRFQGLNATEMSYC